MQVDLLRSDSLGFRSFTTVVALLPPARCPVLLPGPAAGPGTRWKAAATCIQWCWTRCPHARPSFTRSVLFRQYACVTFQDFLSFFFSRSSTLTSRTALRFFYFYFFYFLELFESSFQTYMVRMWSLPDQSHFTPPTLSSLTHSLTPLTSLSRSLSTPSRLESDGFSGHLFQNKRSSSEMIIMPWMLKSNVWFCKVKFSW